MSKYRIQILKAASRDLERLDKPIARRIVQRIHWLSANLNVIRLESLTGDLAGFYKMRVVTIASFMRCSRLKKP